MSVLFSCALSYQRGNSFPEFPSRVSLWPERGHVTTLRAITGPGDSMANTGFKQMWFMSQGWAHGQLKKIRVLSTGRKGEMAIGKATPSV